MSSLNGIRNIVIGIVMDDANKLVNPDSYDVCVATALQVYSGHKPKFKVVDITGDGGNDYALPASWDHGFSVIDSIEYPIGYVPECLVDIRDYTFYQDESSEYIRLIQNQPTSSEEFRVRFTILRLVTEVEDQDVYAFANLAASHCCNMLASLYINSIDPTLSEATVNYRDKSTLYAEQADKLLKVYNDHMGIKEDQGTKGAFTVGNRRYSLPVVPLTHYRY